MLVPPSVPIYSLGFGGPPCLSGEPSAFGSCSVGELEALRGGRVMWVRRERGGEEGGGGGGGVWERPTPLWWPKTSGMMGGESVGMNSWTAHLPITTSAVFAQDVVPTLSISSFLRFAQQARLCAAVDVAAEAAARATSTSTSASTCARARNTAAAAAATG